MASLVRAEPGQLTVHVDQPGIKISPILYGLMTEEINHSYDGGLYAELLQNRIFQDDMSKPVHWSLVQAGDAAGALALDNSQPINAALTTCLKLSVTGAAGNQRIGIANDGYWGIPIKPKTRYRASFYAKASDSETGPLTVDIESNDGATVYATAQVRKLSTRWQRYTVTLKTGHIPASVTNRFVISTKSPGTVWFNLVSLFPPTYYNRPNGNRIDLMQKLADMKPAFLRLPGGNYLEGNTIAERFEWKNTLHGLEQRPGHQGPWGYRSTDGLGLLEFLEWCEDLHIQPVLAVFAGYALGGEHVDAGSQLTPYVQNALDEIEYATGEVHTKWGAARAHDGHPAPFPLTYIEIGNEDFFDRSGSYDARFAQFSDAIKIKYPNLKLIATTPIKSRVPDLYDDHYYRSALGMEQDVHHYDATDRNGPKIFVGEWASTEGNPTPTLNAALGDAAWLTGLERNSDLVVISSYAPLLVNVNPNASQWGTNLIGYDALTSFASPSYYVQKMFSENRGDSALPITIVPQALPTPPTPPSPGKIGLGTWSTQAEFRNIKVAQGDTALYQKDFSTGSADWDLGKGAWTAQDGALVQSSGETDCRATVGNVQWTDYTYTLQARKISGQEGFLILFHIQDNDHYVWWNIGGWGNTRSGLERARGGPTDIIAGSQTPTTVETGRWYDIKVEVKGNDIRCYLDGSLIAEASDVLVHPPPLFATASRVQKTGDVILKVVNISSSPQQLTVDLEGARVVNKKGTVQVLTGQPDDVNTLANPEKIVPQSMSLTGTGRSFLHEFPAYSVSVLRVKVWK